MSNRLAKQTLDLILKNNKTVKRKEEPEKTIRLPDTKKGIKKIKYEIKYGRNQKAKAALAQLEKKRNPLELLYEEQEAIQDNLERNIRILQAHRLKATDKERKMRKKVVEV
ncbi:hypothetical protein BJV82DRAFT_588610 [Fennellomyces sp. T-0311]|nr:hypothetical protein BJV82DRAFT_588610 [Fennellomyces sp. T-0311]